jgi:outer membrane protein OmpA-like peptidoglycan-associated protein
MVDHTHGAAGAAAAAAPGVAHVVATHGAAHGAAPVVEFDEPAGVQDREVPGGLLGTAWPLLVLAIMTVMLVRACIPIGIAPPMAAFDAAAAARIGNEQAGAALAALGADAAPADVAAALNRIVVNFSSGSAEIPADARPVLGRAAGLLMRLPAEARFEIAGHTDSTGSSEGNQRLSEQRARSVANFMVSRGAPSERFAVKGYGDQQPIADNTTERGRFGNRRIAFAPIP